MSSSQKILPGIAWYEQLDTHEQSLNQKHRPDSGAGGRKDKKGGGPVNATSTGAPPGTAAAAAEAAKRCAQLRARAEELLNKEIAALPVRRSEERWVSTVLNSGTRADRVAALTLRARESPAHRLAAVETLVAMSRKRAGGRAEAADAMQALTELFVSVYLPPTRYLRTFAECCGGAVSLDDGPDASGTTSQLPPVDQVPDVLLKLWLVEEQVKALFAGFVAALTQAAADEIAHHRLTALRRAQALLAARPEGERDLLDLVCRRLGDADRTVASKAAYLLHGLLRQHAPMKTVVANAVEAVVFRPHVTQRSQYFGVLVWNQIRLDSRLASDRELAAQLVHRYLTLFRRLIGGEITLKKKAGGDGVADNASKQKKRKKIPKHKRKRPAGGGASSSAATPDDDATESRLMGALLTGVARAIPYAPPSTDLSEHYHALYTVVYGPSPARAIQACAVLLQALFAKDAGAAGAVSDGAGGPSAKAVAAAEAKVVLLDPEVDELKVEFSYSASWHPTDWPFSRRMELYEDSFFSQELEIHWLSIMNSCVLVILLTGFLAIIVMRVLKSDYARYSRADEEDDDQDDYGWKLVHGDVFRFPPHKGVFAAFVGLGAQLLLTTACTLSLSLVGMYYPNNGGAMYSSLIFLYALTSVVGGYVSGSFYATMNGEHWAWNIVLAAVLFTFPLFGVFSFVNSVAWYHGATAALPYTTILIIMCIYLLVGFPLTVLGGIAGRHNAKPFDAPVRTKNFARPVPWIHPLRRWQVQSIMVGFLSFTTCYIELYYIFSSIFGHSSYSLWGILVIVFLILLVVTATITVSLVYFQLSLEDHRWWWSSFISGGSTSLFIFAYSVFFYLYRSKMSGFLQASFYFGYVGIICFYFFLMLGTVGFCASLLFVKRIYRDLKFN